MDFRNIKISNEIYISVLLILISVFTLTCYQTFLHYNKIQDNKILFNLVKTAPYIGDLVHEMQKERGLSAGYISSDGNTVFKNKLTAQHILTDEKIKNFENQKKIFNVKIYSTNLIKKIEIAEKSLAELKTIRKSVFSISTGIPDLTKYYTSIITKHLDIIASSSDIKSHQHVESNPHKHIYESIIAYEKFLQGKEHAGLERAAGSEMFGKGVFSPALYKKFVSLILTQNMFFSNFHELAEPSLKRLFDDIIKGEEIEKIKSMRQILFDTGPNKIITENINPSYWFQVITQKINKMKKVEDLIAKHLIEETKSINKRNLNQLIMLLFLSILLLFFTITLSLKILRRPKKD